MAAALGKISIRHAAATCLALQARDGALVAAHGVLLGAHVAAQLRLPSHGGLYAAPQLVVCLGVALLEGFQLSG